MAVVEPRDRLSLDMFNDEHEAQPDLLDDHHPDRRCFDWLSSVARSVLAETDLGPPVRVRQSSWEPSEAPVLG